MTMTSPIDSTHDDQASAAAPTASAIVPRFLQRKAFEAIRPEIDALDPADYLPINIDIPGSVVSVLGRIENIMSFRERAVALAELDIASFDNRSAERLSSPGFVARRAARRHALLSLSPSHAGTGTEAEASHGQLGGGEACASSKRSPVSRVSRRIETLYRRLFLTLHSLTGDRPRCSR